MLVAKGVKGPKTVGYTFDRPEIQFAMEQIRGLSDVGEISVPRAAGSATSHLQGEEE